MANEYIITHNRIEGCKPVQVTDIVREKYPIRFRLFDGDGELYISGRMQGYDFEPLDDIGVCYGCTELRFYKDGEWVVL